MPLTYVASATERYASVVKNASPVLTPFAGCSLSIEPFLCLDEMAEASHVDFVF